MRGFTLKLKGIGLISIVAFAVIAAGTVFSGSLERGLSAFDDFMLALESGITSGRAGMVPNVVGPVKWRPGHYVTLMTHRSNDPEHLEDVSKEVSRIPGFQGVQIRYLWSDLEPVEGKYDFSRIRRDLKILHKNGLHLSILIQTKSFDLSKREAVPRYLREAKYEGGAYRLTIAAEGDFRKERKLGENIAFWNDKVLGRIQKLFVALGAEFDGESRVASVALTETSLGRPAEPLSKEQKRKFYENLLVADKSLRDAFPHTVIIQYVNYPLWALSNLAQGLVKIGGGFGGPDVFPDDPDLIRGAYQYYPKLRNIVPLAPSVQNENYFTTRHRGKRESVEIERLYRFAKDQLHANFIFWTRTEIGPDSPWERVKEFFGDEVFKGDLSGGLNVRCPAVFDECR